MNDKASVLQIKNLYCSDTHHRYCRTLQTSQFQLKQLRHCQVRGASDFEVLWSTSDGIDNIKPSKLKRTISDYINYEMLPSSGIIFASAIPHTHILPIKKDVWTRFIPNTLFQVRHRHKDTVNNWTHKVIWIIITNK